MHISEGQLERWAKAPSETEEGKCQNAVSQITDAIQDKFGDSVSIFLQGSYRNRTNVKQDSDVDIVVLHEGYYFPETSKLSESDKAIYQRSFISSDYTFTQFKNDVQTALNNTFGSSAVSRENKCITVNGNSYRINADVVPCFVHRRYRSPQDVEAEGIELVTDAGSHIHSFPKQHYANGVEKNSVTNSMYKPVARILKNVRNELIDQNIITSDHIHSFLLECLVWNVLPNSHFHKATYTEATRAVIATIWNEMGNPAKADNYAEVSDLKWLFKGSPDRTHLQVRTFMQHAWDYIGYV